MPARIHPHSLRDYIRGARHTDLERVREIEARCFSTTWRAGDWDRVWGVQNHMTFVATAAPHLGKGGGFVIGYVLGEFTAKGTEILNLAVMPHARFKGFGRALVRQVLDISEHLGVGTRAMVYEKNLCAQEFFKRCGFRVPSLGGIERGVFLDGDGYWFSSEG